MVFDFLNNDYMKAAGSFGSNLGSGVLSTLNNAGSTVGTAVNNAGGYLSSLTGGDQQPQENITKKTNEHPTVMNPNTPSSASLYSSLGNTLNLNSLTSGLSNLQTPNVLGAMNGVGNGISNTMRPFTMGAGSLVEGTPVMNPEPKPNYVDNNRNPINSMLVPSLPTITDASKLMTPYTESAMRSLGPALASRTPNTMIFDAAGNLLTYGGAGAQKLIVDIENIAKDTGKVINEGKDATMEKLGDAGSGVKSVLWDAPYALGGYTGDMVAKSGEMTMQQFEDLIGGARDLTISREPTPDGGMVIKWKPQENPENAKSYATERGSELFNKGEKYISDIPDQYKYSDNKTFNVTKGDISNNGESTYTYIPGQSQMLIKGLRSEGSPDDTETNKILNSASGNTFNPSLSQSLIKIK
jgi:hypothetical protein